MKRILTIFSGSKQEVESVKYSNFFTRQFSAKNDVLHISPEFEQIAKFAFGVGSSSETLYDDFKKSYENENLTKLREVEKKFDAELAAKNSKLIHEQGDICDIASAVGRYYDLIITNYNIENNHEDYLNVINTLIFETGTPIILTPDEEPKHSMDNILIAWDGSVRAAKAVRAALPVLCKAKKVLVIGVNESEKDVASAEELLTYLKSHKVSAKHLGVKKLKYCVGKTILDEAENQNCDLIVMGAYSRPKIRQAILGGATKYMLGHTKIPVLMQH